MPRAAAPLTTGISPKEGPPGTRVTIRGENLGVDPKDLIGLKICGVDCVLSAEWKSPSKIIARTGPGKGKGDVVVITRSGGVGSCTVGFRGYFVQTGPLQESAVWIDESQTVNTGLSRDRPSSPMILKDHDDPLGISDEANESKFPEEDLVELFPEGSGNTSLENFVPAWFLLENHHGTSFDDLKAGLNYLKRRASQSQEGPLAFVKSNLTTFMDCQDTLTAVHESLRGHQVHSKGGHLTYALEEPLKKGCECADEIFQGVLQRKDRADATRNALSVLQRFKFLFNLPVTIERNVQRGDYDLVITDYARARSLFGDTEVEVFKKVYKEVEGRIDAFRDMLRKKLLHLPQTPEEQKKLIRYLVNLEAVGDPAWECLVNQQRWLISLMVSCKDDHITKEKQPQSQTDVEASPSKQRLQSPTISRQPSFKSASKPPQKVLFVEDLTKILTDNFPDLWRLGHTYFSGKLQRVTGDRPSRIDPNKHAFFKAMISEVINLLSSLIRAAFLTDSLEHVTPEERESYGMWPQSKHYSPGDWLPHCVRFIRSAVHSICNLDLGGDAQEMLQELAFDMRTNCMSTLLKQAIDDIKALDEREMWMVETDDELGGTTQLPMLYENIVSETIQHLDEVVMQTKPGETEIFSQRPVQKEATDLCTHLLVALATCLEQLAFYGNAEREVKNVAPPASSPVHRQSSSNSDESRRSAVHEDMLRGSLDGMPSLEKRLIVMLSNCTHTLEHVMPRLVENLDKHGYPEMDKVTVAAEIEYGDLYDRLFDSYIEEKSNPIVGTLEQRLYAGHFDWNDCLKPTGVRSYIKATLMDLIEVHAEIFSIAPTFVQRLMCHVIEVVSEEFARLIQCVTGFSTHGALQARLEVYALQEALSDYATPETSQAFQEALDCIPSPTDTKDVKLLEELLNRFKLEMKFQLMCFQGHGSRRIDPA